jgi:hypothetical protein
MTSFGLQRRQLRCEDNEWRIDKNSKANGRGLFEDTIPTFVRENPQSKRLVTQPTPEPGTTETEAYSLTAKTTCESESENGAGVAQSV